MAERYANSSFNYYWSVVHVPRRQPATLLLKIASKRKELKKEGHLGKVTQPTDWVLNSMVVSSFGEKRYLQLKQYILSVQSTYKHEHSNKQIQMAKTAFWNKIRSRKSVPKGHG